MFLIGQACMVAVYAGVWSIGINVWTLALCLLLHGAYYAATDGVLAALISGATRPDVRASGLAALTTATSVARLCGSIVAGLIWSWRGPEAVVMVALLATVATLVWSTFTLRGVTTAHVESGRAQARGV
jgi:MFS family permease